MNQNNVSHASAAADQPPGIQPLPELLTAPETIAYLRLDIGEADPNERLRNLVRRHGLPAIKRGHLLLFRRSVVDEWLAAGQKNTRRITNLARLKPIQQRLQRVTSKAI